MLQQTANKSTIYEDGIASDKKHVVLLFCLLICWRRVVGERFPDQFVRSLITDWSCVKWIMVCFASPPLADTVYCSCLHDFYLVLVASFRRDESANCIWMVQRYWATKRCPVSTGENNEIFDDGRYKSWQSFHNATVLWSHGWWTDILSIGINWRFIRLFMLIFEFHSKSLRSYYFSKPLTFPMHAIVRFLHFA